METLSSAIYPEFLRAIQASGGHPMAFLPGLITDPVAVFLMILAIMLVAPLLFERLRLPGIVGLILADVVVDPNGLVFWHEMRPLSCSVQWVCAHQVGDYAISFADAEGNRKL